MESFTYCVPTEIVFGQGAEDNTAAEVAKFGGRRVLIVAGGRSARRSGLLDRLEKQLDDAGLAHAAFEGAQPNPRLAHAREGVRAALAFGADFILAVNRNFARKITFGQQGYAALCRRETARQTDHHPQEQQIENQTNDDDHHRHGQGNQGFAHGIPLGNDKGAIVAARRAFKTGERP